MLRDADAESVDLGIRIGRLYTDHGYPIDSAFDKLVGYDKGQMVSIVHGVCIWLVQHKRNSGATDKAIERQRETNKNIITRFINTGEVGVY